MRDNVRKMIEKKPNKGGGRKIKKYGKRGKELGKKSAINEIITNKKQQRW